MGVGGQRHAPAALPTGKRLGIHCIGGWDGPQGRSGRVQKILTPTGIPSPDHPSRSQSLHKGADKSLARRGRKKATATEDFDFHISYL